MCAATDADFESVQRVIAHEYFHNWSGNRVTCRDWFQLTLKEGLTVFRDQQVAGRGRLAEKLAPCAGESIKWCKIDRMIQFPRPAGQ
jgi:hypothetical protein